MMKIAFAGFRHAHIFTLYEAIKKNSELEFVGAFEAHLPSKQDAASKGVCFTYDSYNAILQDAEVDIVAIGDYYGARGKLVIQALKAGKHVLVDKPLCTHLYELQEINRLLSEGNLVVGIMLDLLDSPNFQNALNVIREGILGRINNIVFEGQHPLLYGKRPEWYYNQEMHGGVINDIAIHGMDLVRLITGSELEEVIGARCWNFYAKAVPDWKDSAQFMLRLSDGTGVIGDVSYASPDTQGYSHPAYWHFRVWGENGMMDFGINTSEVQVYLNGKDFPEKISKEKSENSYLLSFLSAVKEPCLREEFNRRMLAATKQTLLIQEKADRDNL